MRGNHFVIIFSLIALILSNVQDVSADEFSVSVRKKIEISDAFMNAVDAGAKALIASDHKKGFDKEKAVWQFFATLSASLGILDNPDKREILKLYVPVIAVIEEDGFYVLFSREYEDEGIHVSKQWSELIPYSYEDAFFIYRFTLGDKVTLYDKQDILGDLSDFITIDYHEAKTNPDLSAIAFKDLDNIMLDDEKYLLIKRNAIMKRIQEYLNYYINQHNDIAKHFGITYEFMMPDMDDSEWSRSIMKEGMLVAFQGYPYYNGKDVYNQFVVTAAQLKRLMAYYIVPREWYFIYHKEECNYFIKGDEIKTCYDVKECASEGAFACEYCFPKGIHVRGIWRE